MLIKDNCPEDNFRGIPILDTFFFHKEGVIHSYLICGVVIKPAQASLVYLHLLTDVLTSGPSMDISLTIKY